MRRRPEASRLYAFTPLAFGFLTGKHRKGRPIDLEAGRAAIRPAFFDPAIAENAAKLDAVGQLVELARHRESQPQLWLPPSEHPVGTWTAEL
ncbi:hypothetical protein ACFYUM_25065 [Streptomyces fimicarius]|uniref:hypothetical protein n=1 Tax=Streptomyces griseus TaxID=1911 RepID=UPI0036BED90C